MSSSIEANELCFSYFEDGKNILDSLTASFDSDRITVLTGRSGCGKSTLLYVAAGLYPHNAGFIRGGRVTVDGVELKDLDPAKRCRIAGMMFQNPDLQFCMDTVRNEMIFCLENTGDDPSGFEERIDKALDFCEIRALKTRTLNTLSGGEKQRVALACLVALKSSWLLLDEPFANVDDFSAKTILGKIKKLHEEKHVGILAVDHRVENWAGIADSVMVFENGKIREAETCDLRTAYFPVSEDAPGSSSGGSPLFASGLKSGSAPDRSSHFAACAASRSAENDHNLFSDGSSAEHTDRGTQENTGATPGPADICPLLVMENVNISHAKKQPPFLTGISAVFQKGRSCAVMGQSGCGKSTLFGALEGLYPWTGKILFDGEDLKKYHKKSFGKIGFVTQNPQDQFIGGTVSHEIMAALRNVPDAEEKCREILKSIHLWKYRDISPYMLSQGQQRRLGVAVLMAYPCELLICDEPTYAQDPENTAAIMNYLTRQVKSRGITMIFSTHDPIVAETWSDEILEIHDGHIRTA